MYGAIVRPIAGRRSARLCPDLVRVAGRHDPDIVMVALVITTIHLSGDPLVKLGMGMMSLYVIFLICAAARPHSSSRLLALVRPERRPVRRVRTKLPLLPGGDVWHAGVDRLLRDGVRGFNGRRRFLTREVCTERVEGSELWRWIVGAPLGFYSRDGVAMPCDLMCAIVCVVCGRMGGSVL